MPTPKRNTRKPALGAVAQIADTRPGKHTIPVGECRLTVNLPAALHMDLKLHAVRQRTDMSSIVERLVADYLKAAQ